MAKRKWTRSDRPTNSMHLDAGECGGRVMRTRHGGAFEWTSWNGKKGQRVLHHTGFTQTQKAAKLAAERSCRLLLAKK